jgi:hypothetical protein
MRKAALLFLTLCLSTALSASGFFTLSEMKPTHVFVMNTSNLLDKEDVDEIKKILTELVESLGLKPEQRDTPTLMVKISSITADKKHFIHVKLAVGEDVITTRKGALKSFALTYDSEDFIQSEKDPKEDILDSVQFLIDEFSSHYSEDNE